LLIFLKAALVVARPDVALAGPEVGVGNQRRVWILDEEGPERRERLVVASLHILLIGPIITFFVASRGRGLRPRDAAGRVLRSRSGAPRSVRIGNDPPHSLFAQ